MAKRTPKQTSSTANIIVVAAAITLVIIIILAVIAWSKCRRSNGIQQEQIPLKNREQGANDSTVLDAPAQHYEAAPSPERGELHVDTDIHDACNRGNLPRVKRILSQGNVDIESKEMHGRTPIMLAAYWGHGDMFNVIMSEQPDVSKLDKDGNNILHLACYGGDMKVVKYVLSQNMADINSRNQQGKTPLMWAASCGHKELFIYLLDIGHADMSQVDNDGNTVLHLACCGGNNEVVDSVLLQNIVHIDSRGHEGKTPAMMAAEKGRKSVLDLLKSNGADLSLKDKFSNNAYQLARLNGHEEITKDLAASCLVM
ncbi:fibronectin type 3 and ankyrin repeat domains protein 1-like [Haliotis cracherodii]|uniref:fibronectin type 3 and ankyrin repeat domains protein 1-like n=1 Tax=Haliotis cracherodii TaxID=6455 RepID=UPI0039EAF788